MKSAPRVKNLLAPRIYSGNSKTEPEEFEYLLFHSGTFIINIEVKSISMAPPHLPPSQSLAMGCTDGNSAGKKIL